MDAQTDACTNARTKRQHLRPYAIKVHRQTDILTDGRTYTGMDRQIDVWTDERNDASGRTDDKTIRRTADEWTDRQTDVLTDAGTDAHRCTDGQTDS